MDLAIREFTAQLVAEINRANLPLEVKRLAVLDIYNKIEKAADTAIAQAMQERQERIKKETEKAKEKAKEEMKEVTEE